VHPDAYAEPEKRPKWAKTTLQDARDLVGDLDDTMRKVDRYVISIRRSNN